MGKIKVGWFVPTYGGAQDSHMDSPAFETVSYALIKDSILLCEQLGYDSVWTADHLMYGKDGTILECWTTLSAAASLAKRLRLGALVLCESHRHPSLTAKMAATLDVISGGRFDYGIGAGWRKVEQEAYGLPWNDSAVVRIHRMEENIEIVKRMWTEEKATFEGKYYRIKDAVCNPKPVQKPHPPIWIGGGGEKLMLRDVAKYADGWNWNGSVEVFQHKMEVLKNHCLEVKRNFKEITVSWTGWILLAPTERELRKQIERIKKYSPKYPLSPEILKMNEFNRPTNSSVTEVYDFMDKSMIGTPDTVIKRVQEYMDIGVTYLIPFFIDFPSTNGIKMFAKEVMPSFS